MQEHRKQVREIPANPFLQKQNRGKRLRVAAYCRISTEQEVSSLLAFAVQE